MLDALIADHRIDINYLNALFTAAMEFRSVHTLVELTANGPDWDADDSASGGAGDVEIGIEILLGEEQEKSRSFSFWANVTTLTRVELGPRLAGAFISLPCAVGLGGDQEFDVTAPVEVSAREISLEAKSLILRSATHGGPKHEVVLRAHQLASRLENILTNNVPLTISLSGWAVLGRLIEDKVLSLDGDRYYLNPAALNNHLGLTWVDLRKGRMPQKLVDYLESVPCPKSK